MRKRLGLVLAVLTIGATAPASWASRHCPMIGDDAGDTRLIADGPMVAAPELDLRSVDVGSTATSITAVVRVGGLAVTRPDAAFGLRWGIRFKVHDTRFAMWARTDSTGAVSYFSRYYDSRGFSADLPAGTVGSVDLSRDEVRITAPLSVFSTQESIKRGTWLNDVEAATGRNLGVDRLLFLGADEAGFAEHRVGARSCAG